MIVADQGRGMAVTKNGNAGVGLSSIRRQASLIHAALEMVPGPGHTLKLTVPTTDISNL
jgi:signal transduction histidine kinase